MANEHYANEFFDKALRAQVSSSLVSLKGNVCPFAVRLAWHASGTFDSSAAEGDAQRGGSDGATMRFEPEITDGANAGLAIMQDLLKDVQKKCPGVSIADLWTLAGTQAIALAGGPEIPFGYGRSDASDSKACPPNGRLPDATQGAQHLRDVFYRMGFNDREIVALSGAHTLGSCHRLRSGFDGPWTTNPLKFDNEYFRNLLEIEWKPREWDGPLQFTDPSGKLMMLPTDMALIQDDKFKPVVEEYAKNQEVFFKDFAAAFGALLSKGCPAHCQPGASVSKASVANDDSAAFRDLAMHGSVERMKELASKGGTIDPNSKEPHSNRTALHKASFFGHAHVVTYLVTDHKANVNQADAVGDTPLHDAARLGHVEVVQALQQAGADASLTNGNGKKASELAAANGKDKVVALLG